MHRLKLIFYKCFRYSKLIAVLPISFFVKKYFTDFDLKGAIL